MLKWFVCMLAIAAAFLFNYYLESPIPVDKYLLITAVTGFVFAWSAPALYTQLSVEKLNPITNVMVVTKSFVNSNRWTIPLMLFATALGGASMWLLNEDMGNVTGLFLWLGAILSVLLAWWWRIDPQPEPDVQTQTKPLPSQQPCYELLLLVTILIAAFVVRIWRLDLFPNGLQSDEGGNARDALQWLSGAPYTPYAETNVGQATMFTYMIALLFHFGGVSLELMRLTSVLVGTVTIGAFYPLVRRLFSAPVALFATALFAFDRWHMTFSRIVYELILTPLALILTYYFVYLAITERRGRYWVLAGLSVAFGLNTYTAFRISVIGAPLLVLFWLLRDYRKIGANIKFLILCTFSSVVGLIPLLIYTIHHPDIVLLRTRQVYIGTEIANTGSYAPLWLNIRRYLEMFTIHGDPAGLNNLPDVPMLSWTIGILAMLGLCYALYHWWKLEMFMLLCWIIGVLPAGILSITVETPSARRVIGMVPLIYLLVAIVAEALWRLWTQRLPRFGSVIWRLASVCVVCFIAYTSLQQFYGTQFKNQSVNESFNPIESSVGHYLRSLDSNSTLVYLDGAFHDNAVVDFLGGNFPHVPFSLIEHLPLRNATPGKNVIFVLSPNSDALEPLFTSFYPKGSWQTHQDQFGMNTFQTFSISEQQLEELQGLTTSYYSDFSRKQPAVIVQYQPQVGSMPSPLPAPYVVDWGGTIYMPVHGTYTISVAASSPITLAIDSNVVLTTPEKVKGTELITLSVSRPLAAGFHDLELQADVANYTSSSPKLYWEGPANGQEEVPASALLTNRIPPIGLMAAYYDNTNWEGSPYMVRRDLSIMADESIQMDYSVIWTGKLKVPQDGHYLLGTTSDDGSLVYLDGALVLDNGLPGGTHHLEVGTDLKAGFHDVEIRYYQSGGSRFMKFEWQPPGMPWQSVAGDSLSSNAVNQELLVASAKPAQIFTDEAILTNPAEYVSTPLADIQVLVQGLQAPGGIAVGANNHVYVVDSGKRRLLILSEDGSLIHEVLEGDSRFEEPFDVASDSSDHIYVQDGGLGKIVVFDSEGKYLQTMPSQPRFERARGVFVDSDHQVWVAQTAAGEVMSTTWSSDEVVTLSRPLLDNFQPVDVIVHPDGNIWITDGGRHQLYLLSREGALVFTTPIPPAYTISGSHLAIDADNFVYMTQPEAGKIVKYDSSGHEVAELDLRAHDIVKPVGITIDAQHAIWVTDAERGTVVRIIWHQSSTLQPTSPLLSQLTQPTSPLTQ